MRGFLRTRRGRLLTVASVVVVAAIGATAAWAAIGDGGIVKTCFSASQGPTWRPISSGSSCRAGETEIDFYSKSGADAAFAAAGSSYTKSESDSRYLGINAKAADSDKLDGIDSTGFLGVNAKAADSDKLDGLDSTAFLTKTYEYSGQTRGIPADAFSSGPVQGVADAVATSGEADVSLLSPNVDTTATNLRAQLTGGSPTGAGSGNVVLFVNGQSTQLFCSVGAASSCTRAGPVSVPANSTLFIRILNAGGAAAPGIMTSFTLTTS